MKPTLCDLTNFTNMKIIDATNLKLGRLASHVAKEALGGEQVVVINAEKAIITGRKKDILANYMQKRKVGSRYKGPFFPRVPNLIVRRTIRGMLPYKKETGRNAFKRIRVYIGVPKEVSGKEFATYEDAKLGMIEKRSYITVEEVAKLLGWHE